MRAVCVDAISLAGEITREDFSYFFMFPSLEKSKHLANENLFENCKTIE